MRMKIDKSWRNRQAVGIDDALCAAVDSTGIDNPAVLHRHVAEVRRQTTAIVNSSALDQYVVSHGQSSLDQAFFELIRSTDSMSNQSPLVSAPDCAMGRTDPFQSRCMTMPISPDEPKSPEEVQQWIEKHTREHDRFSHVAAKYDSHRVTHGCY